ncbi:MAG: cyclophilin-like fold protein [Anaerolineae bacterium]
MRQIRIEAGSVSATAALNDSPTADAVWDALPIEGRASTWGDEVYFSIPVNVGEAGDSQEVVALGEIGYWPPGHAFCIFFGRTPMSRGNEIRPASAVNVLGAIEGDATVFKRVSSGTRVVIAKVEA